MIPRYPAPEPNSSDLPPETPAPEAQAPERLPSCVYQKIRAVCSLIHLYGIPDTMAAAMAGVTRSTLAYWKTNEDIEMELEQARGQYLVGKLQRIGDTLTKDGQFDWRAQAWLVKYATPKEQKPPSDAAAYGKKEGRSSGQERASKSDESQPAVDPDPNRGYDNNRKPWDEVFWANYQRGHREYLAAWAAEDAAKTKAAAAEAAARGETPAPDAIDIFISPLAPGLPS
jgi:hypothetical protein